MLNVNVRRILLTIGCAVIGSLASHAQTNPPTADSVSPNSGFGTTQTFTFKYSSVNGFSYITSVYGLINSALNGAGGCFFQYYAPGNTLYLYSDAGNAVAGTLMPGSTPSINNSQCTLSGPGFTATGSGNQRTVTVPITFSNTFTGAKSVYGYVTDLANRSSGWQPLGTWTTNTILNNPPTADSVSPSSGSGTSQTFTFKYSSVNGFAYLTAVYGLINSSLNGAGACFFQYYAPSKTLYLYSDAGNTIAGTLGPNSPSINNSQCTISGNGFIAEGNGNQLTIAIPIAFSNSFTGLKNVYAYAGDQANMYSGWNWLGIWSEVSLQSPPTADSVSPSSGSGASQTFTYQFSSVYGYGQLSFVEVLMNISLTATNACFWLYDAQLKTLYLLDDAATGWVGSMALGSSSSLNNSQCTISGPGFTATGSGPQLKLAIPIAFSSTFRGSKNVYGNANDQGSQSSGWQPLGTWTTQPLLNLPPTADSVLPVSGTGSPQTFTFKYSSVNGFNYLDAVYGLINTGLSGSGACFFQYAPAADLLYLYGDDGSTVPGTLVLGGSPPVHNSQCTIIGTGFTASSTATQLTITIPIAFSSTFTGAMKVYGFASDMAALNSGWQQLGIWTL